jgi:outer membrane immunogenic protein
MSKGLIAGLGMVVSIAGPAFAADMPVKTPLKPPYSWTGCYVGLNAGLFYGLDRYDNTPSGAFVGAVGPAGIVAGQTSYSPGGGSNGQAYTYGVQAGCNLQWNSVVLGVEADFNGTALDETILVAVPQNAFFLGRNENVSTKPTWVSTVRARAGVTPVDGWLFYATGGLAIERVRGFYQSQFTDGTTFLGTATPTRTGWAAGAGVEWDVAPSWTVKLEYLYLDFGTFSFISPNTSFAGGPAVPAFTWTTSIHSRDQTVRIGVNYRFGGPVIASY